MDIEKLRKDLLENSNPYCLCVEDDLMQAAATALSTLQAENEQLCSDLLRLQTERDTLWAANQNLLAERDADRKEG